MEWDLFMTAAMGCLAAAFWMLAFVIKIATQEVKGLVWQHDKSVDNRIDMIQDQMKDQQSDNIVYHRATQLAVDEVLYRITPPVPFHSPCGYGSPPRCLL
jgi:hypothetical protein